MTTPQQQLEQYIRAAAKRLGVSPVDLATAISYETGGTFDPTIKGPTTKWGQHQGLLQWGEPQAQKYLGGDFSIPKQMDGAVSYLQDAGVKPGMGLLDIYSAINAGGVGPKYYARSDTAAGGAPGTVRDKVEQQMAGHREKAMAMFGQDPVLNQPQQDFVKNNPQPGGFGPGLGDPNVQPNWDSPGSGNVMSPQFDGGIPEFVADYFNENENKPNMMQRLGAALSAFDPPPPPPAGFSGGSGPGNQLLKYLNSPTMADILLKKRLG